MSTVPRTWREQWLARARAMPMRWRRLDAQTSVWGTPKGQARVCRLRSGFSCEIVVRPGDVIKLGYRQNERAAKSACREWLVGRPGMVMWHEREPLVEEARRRMRQAADAIRIRFPGSERTVVDLHTGKQSHALKGVVRRMARKHKAEEIRRIRRMLRAAKPGSMQEQNLRAYMAVLLRKSGGTGKMYVPDEKALPSWRDVPDYAERRRASRGSLWTIDYRAVWPQGGGLWRVAVVRAMSVGEAVEKLRTVERGVRLTRVRVTAGHDVPGYPQSRVLW